MIHIRCLRPRQCRREARHPAYDSLTIFYTNPTPPTPHPKPSSSPPPPVPLLITPKKKTTPNRNPNTKKHQTLKPNQIQSRLNSSRGSLRNLKLGKAMGYSTNHNKPSKESRSPPETKQKEKDTSYMRKGSDEGGDEGGRRRSDPGGALRTKKKGWNRAPRNPRFWGRSGGGVGDWRDLGAGESRWRGGRERCYHHQFLSPLSFPLLTILSLSLSLSSTLSLSLCKEILLRRLCAPNHFVNRSIV